MSRIGKSPIALTDKVKVEPRDGAVEVTGPLGKLVQNLPPGTAVKVEKNQVLVELVGPADETSGARHGLARSLVNNAVVGVSQGFNKNLEIIGLGYRAQVTGDKLSLQLGFANPKEFKLPAGIKVVIDPKQTALSISGVDCYLVGEVAAQIRR